MAVQVVAEAGVNHNGDLQRALTMVEVAKACGADTIKFQTFKSSALASNGARMADYQVANTGGDIGQLAMLQGLELSADDHVHLLARCQEFGINFLSSAFDLLSIELLYSLGLRTYKIPSGEITNLPYLERVGSLAQEAILSTGMSDMHEVGAALDVLLKAGLSTADITLLHCTTEYPAPFDEVNLRAMVTLKETFGTPVGYSDHTTGNAVAVAAVALGASIIEKHFTLDRTLPGPDHVASLEPPELKELVSEIRRVEMALGDGLKRPMPSELKNRDIVRKSIHLSTNVERGHVLTATDLTTKRPGDGISPMRLREVIGLKVNRALPAGTKLEQTDLET